MQRQWLILALISAGAPVTAAADQKGPRFETDVRPILKAHCWQCHGEEEELKGGLDTRLARFLKKGGESGPAIVAGEHAESLLFQRVVSGEMPPGTKRLTAKEIAIIAKWIDGGASTIRPEPKTLSREGSFTEEERGHWSFQSIVRPSLPPTQQSHLLKSPIDAFLLARLEAAKFEFAAEADRPTLIRRLKFNLHGLPPTLDEIDRFVNDSAPDAYKRLVDRMLASPAYGERWARHWLDIVGYADSDGVTKEDYPRGWAFKYRDYVIRSLNANKPWNRFLIEQLAGDELLKPPYRDLTPEQSELLIATGFLRMSPDGTRGVNDDYNRNQVVAEVIKVVSTSLLGLSVGCAQCHQHRYDPITHTDYYRMRALFEPAYDWKNWRSPGGRLISNWSAETRQKAEAVDQEVRQLTAKRDAELNDAADKAVEARIAKLPADLQEKASVARQTPEKNRTDEQKKFIEAHAFLKVNGNSLQEIDGAAKNIVLKKWDPQISAAQKKRPPTDNIMCLTEVPGKVPSTRLFARGDFKQPRDDVAPGELSVLNAADFEISGNDPSIPSTGRRLAYARHLTSGKHPLVARVLVNRFWMHHFGTGLVATPGNFGAQGVLPSHPQLLDWLADEFMKSGWDLKHLHRLIVTSAAYRQVSTRRNDLNAIDPDNRLLGRMSVRRLEAEILRDSLLELSGRLVGTMHGKPSPVSLDRVGQRVVIAAQQYDSTGRLLRNVAALSTEKFRRTIYVQVRRSMQLGVLVPFDPPTLKPNCELRTSSTGATQSLLMMNDPFVIRQVDALAARVQRESGDDRGQQFRLAWRLVLGREPTDVDQQNGIRFLDAQVAALRSENAKDADVERTALSHLCHALVSSNGFLYVD